MENTVLNYVWVNRRNEQIHEPESSAIEAEGKPDGTLKGATAEKIDHMNLSLFAKPYEDSLYLSNIIKVAKEHPEIRVYIWLDRKRTKLQDQEDLQAYINDIRLTNVEIKDLNSTMHLIHSDSEHPDRERKVRELLMQGETTPEEAAFNHNSAIWRQADIARLLAMQAAFEDPSVKHVLYSDMDIGNLSEKWNEIIGLLKDHSCVVGETIHTANGKRFLENHFLGFTREARASDFLDSLSAATQDAATDDKHPQNGWHILKNWLYFRLRGSSYAIVSGLEDDLPMVSQTVA